MSMRDEFEEFCRRTRPPMATHRQHFGRGPYSWTTTQAAWRAWQYLEKRDNPHSPVAKAVNHEQH